MAMGEHFVLVESDGRREVENASAWGERSNSTAATTVMNEDEVDMIDTIVAVSILSMNCCCSISVGKRCWLVLLKKVGGPVDGAGGGHQFADVTKDCVSIYE